MAFNLKKEIEEFKQAFPKEMENIYAYNLSKQKNVSKLVSNFNKALIKGMKELRDNDPNIDSKYVRNKITEVHSELMNIIDKNLDKAFYWCSDVKIFQDDFQLLSVKDKHLPIRMGYINPSKNEKNIIKEFLFNHEIAHALRNIPMKLDEYQANYEETIADSFATIRLIQKHQDKKSLNRFINKLSLLRFESLLIYRDITHYTSHCIDKINETNNKELFNLDLKETLDLAVKIADQNRFNNRDLALIINDIVKANDYYENSDFFELPSIFYYAHEHELEQTLKSLKLINPKPVMEEELNRFNKNIKKKNKMAKDKSEPKIFGKLIR